MSKNTSSDKNKPSSNQSKHLKQKFPSCCVKNCDEYFQDQIREYEKFPKSEEIKKKWIKVLGIVAVTNKTRICDKHFTSKDYRLNNLNKTAVPSLFLNLENPMEVKSENQFEQFEIQNVYVKEEVEYEENTESQDHLDSSKHTCRICLKIEESESMVWLHDQHKIEESVAGLYTYCTGLEVEHNDKLPQYVCKDCFDKLEDACKLKKTSIESHFILKSRLESDEEEKEEVPFEVAQFLSDYREDSNTDSKNPFENIERKIRSSPRKSHRSSKHFKPTFFCDVCKKDIQGSKFYHLKEHKKSGIEPIKECDACNRKFYLNADFVDHHCQPCIKTCEICQINFELAEDFKKHLEETHFKNGVYICQKPNCNVKETKVYHAYHHIRWHKYHFEKVCNVCGMKFLDPLRFNSHRNNHNKAKVTLICDLCGIQISDKSNMSRHMKTLHLKLKFYCELCPKNYTNTSMLKVHKMRKHGLEASFKCETCNQSFVFQSQLNYHLKAAHKSTSKARRTREEIVKSLTCATCNRVFNNQTNLMRHQELVHLKLRPFSCERCGKSFGQKTHLETHIRIHTGEKPFQCKFCEMEVKYSDRSTLSKHIKSQHKGMTAT